jgi:predicted kinase/uncharacterized glyoxalase superfamily protein PhnB
VNVDVRRMTTTTSRLTPLLVVRGAARAIDFYVHALGATVLARFEHGPHRHLSHADLALGSATWSLTEELRAWNSDAPDSLGGSPVVMQLEVEDAGATVTAMLDAGATTVFPLVEFLGERMARLRDPFGHVWILKQPLERLSLDEIARRRDELFEHFSRMPIDVSPSTTTALAVAEDTATVRDAGSTSQPQNTATPHVHLVVGPVGAGKSTFARQLARDRRALRLALDEWMAELFTPDRPETGRREWYVERRQRCQERMWAVARATADAGTEVVLELGLLRRDERERFYRVIEDAGFRLVVHVLDAPRDVRRERVMRRNLVQGETFSMVVPPEFFELASDLWESLPPAECEGRDVRQLFTET